MTTNAPNYDGVTVKKSISVDMSTVHLRPGEFITVYAGEECVEVLMKHDKSIQVCVSDNISPAFFKEIYGA